MSLIFKSIASQLSDEDVVSLFRVFGVNTGLQDFAWTLRRRAAKLAGILTKKKSACSKQTWSPYNLALGTVSPFPSRTLTRKVREVLLNQCRSGQVLVLSEAQADDCIRTSWSKVSVP